MNAPKIRQRTAKKIILRLTIGVGILLCIGLLSVLLVLYSKPTQQFLYNYFAAPSLAEIGVTTNFSGFDYSDDTFSTKDLEIKINGTETALLYGVSLKKLRWRDGGIYLNTVTIDSIYVEASDTAALYNWYKEMQRKNTNGGYPLKTDSVVIDHFCINLPKQRLWNGNLSLADLSWNDHLSINKMESIASFDTVPFSWSINDLMLGDSSTFELDGKSPLGMNVDGLVNYNDRTISVNFGAHISSDFNSKWIPEEWQVYFRGLSVDVRATGESFSSFKARIEFNQESIGGSATVTRSFNDYGIYGSIDLNDQAYNYSNLPEWLKNETWQASTVDYKIQGSQETGRLYYDVQAKKGWNTARVWSEDWNETARVEVNLPDFRLGILNGGSLKAAIKPNLEALINNESTEIIGLAPILDFNEYSVRGFSFNWNHRLGQDSIWWSCLDSLMDTDGYLLSIDGSWKSKGSINALGLEILDPLDTGQILSAQFSGAINEEFLGHLNAQDFRLIRPADLIEINSLNIIHEIKGASRIIGISSNVMQGYLEGSFDWNGLRAIPGVLFEDLAGGPPVHSSVNANLAFEANSVDWLSQLLHTGIDLPEGGYLTASFMDSSDHWNYKLNVPELKFDGLHVFAIQGTGSKEEQSVQASITADAVHRSNTYLDSVKLRWASPNNMPQFTVSATVRDSIPTNFIAGAQYLEGVIRPKFVDLEIGEYQASLQNAAPLYWSPTSFHTDSIILDGSLGTLRIRGGVGEKARFPLNLSVTNFDAGLINYWYRDPSLSLAGQIDGYFNIQEALFGPEGVGSVQWSSLLVNNELLGNYTSNIRWSTADRDIYVNSKLIEEGDTYASIVGHYDPYSDDLDMVLAFERFEIHPFEPVLNNILTETTGSLSGSARVVGPIKRWEADGEFYLADPHFNIPIVGAQLSSSMINFSLDENKIELDSAHWTDGLKDLAVLTWGKIEYDRFSAFDFDLHLQADSAMGMRLNRAYNSSFFGTGIIDGSLNLDGPIEQIHLDLNAKTKSGSVLKIPLDNPTEVETPSFLRFVSNESRMPADTIKMSDHEYFTTDMEIEIVPDARVELILDEVMGDIISSRGSGSMRAKILEDESFELYGLYTIASGDYLFTLQGIINKPFELIPGGTILWSGNLYEAEVNLQAKYTVNTSLKGLVTNANYSNENVDVDLIISLSGSLMQPEIEFNILLPNSPSSYQQELDRRILTADVMNYQAFSLLMLGDFYRQNLGVQEGVNLGNSFTRTTSEVLVSQFGTWITAGLGSYVDLELDYTTGNNPYNTLIQSGDEIRLGVSKDFLDGRLRINSSLDVPIAQDGSSTLILGDTQIEYSISKDGRTILRAFNRSNRNDPLLQNTSPYTQGVGIQFRKDFEGK